MLQLSNYGPILTLLAFNRYQQHNKSMQCNLPEYRYIDTLRNPAVLQGLTVKLST
jgi:hypothetical protein